MAQNINRTFHKSGEHKAIPTTSKNISADGLGGTNKFSTIFKSKMFPTESKIFHDKQKSANKNEAVYKTSMYVVTVSFVAIIGGTFIVCIMGIFCSRRLLHFLQLDLGAALVCQSASQNDAIERCFWNRN